MSFILPANDKIFAAKKQDAEVDTSALEWHLDQLVFGLYGLTKEEIAIVEGTWILSKN